MTLKYQYESKSDIPAGLEAHYAEQDGVFVLQAEGVKTDADVQAIKDTLEKERKARREAEAEKRELQEKFADVPDDFSSDEWHRLKDATIDVNKERDAALKEQRERLEAQFKKKEDALNDKLSSASSLVDKHVKMAALRKAIAENNVAKPYQGAVESMFRDRIRMEGEGDDMEVLFDERPIGEAFKEWAQSDEGKNFVSVPANSGGGAGGSSGTGQNKKLSDMNEQERKAFYESNPDEFKRQAQQMKS